MNNRTQLGTLLMACCLSICSGCSCIPCKEKKETSAKVATTTQTKENTVETTQKTASGLQYKVVTQGNGESPVLGQTVTVHYTGHLYDPQTNTIGAKFDSSVDRGAPFEFSIGVGHVIAGWDEGVMDMKVGEKRVLIIPPSLGYGARGAGNVIPPNATLHFEVELLKV